ncbi:hypothetical protein SHI21_12620 [Bacteriovorax sp. PP10]|uniref:GIY-YIG nuclease family protein n=1 Tax=Bacteriovorax antarcticus TaxID=3088717 RepID=A0ABU5VZR1_9BACT|nr:hypothetical protein [Bacteriovorax sp. PP10]MEA9357060.1 hypothetical protein [Bacteriovorax sp. PP10]
MDQNDLSLDLLLQETLALTEYLRASTPPIKAAETPVQTSFLPTEDDTDYLFDLADSMIQDEVASEIPEQATHEENIAPPTYVSLFPETPGVIYKIHNGPSTFCVRGYTTLNIKEAFFDLNDADSTKRPILKLSHDDDFSSVLFFETDTFELAEAVREQIINRRFPHQEDAVCNISDPGFSWWMDESSLSENGIKQGRFEIFFKSHGINRADKYIQLGPIGDGSVAALRMNQAKTLLRSSFPISEFSCDDKSITVASQKPDHLGFISFKNIFLEGINHTTMENFPDNSMGRTLFYYFHELAIVRKFWIEVKTKLG